MNKKGRVMENIEKHIKTIVLLVFLHLMINRLYNYAYPDVNPIKATLIGLTALLAMIVPFVRNFIGVSKLEGFLPIYASALFGALLAQAGVIISKTTESALVHIGILAAAYIAIKAVSQIRSNVKSGKKAGI